MSKSALTKLTDAELVDRFAEMTRKRGQAVRESNVRVANRIYGYMDEIDSILRTRGIDARKGLLPLLDSKERYVQYFAAKRLLGIVPERAREIIESNHKFWVDAISLDAGMTLFNLDNGVFKPD